MIIGRPDGRMGSCRPRGRPGDRRRRAPGEMGCCGAALSGRPLWGPLLRLGSVRLIAGGRPFMCVSVSVRVFRELRLFCPPGMLALPPGGGEGGRRGLSCTGPARRKRLTGPGVPLRARGRKGLHTRAARSGFHQTRAIRSGVETRVTSPSPPFSRPRNVSTPRLSWERGPHREKSLMDLEEFRLGNTEF